jgi:hypothetical protein
MAVRLVWNPSIGAIPQSYGTSQIPGGHSGLLDQVDRSRSPHKDYGEESASKETYLQGSEHQPP